MVPGLLRGMPDQVGAPIQVVMPINPAVDISDDVFDRTLHSALQVCGNDEGKTRELSHICTS